MSYPEFPFGAQTPTLFMNGFSREKLPYEKDAEPDAQLAANALVKEAIKRYPQIIPNAQNVVRGMTGGQLSQGEVDALTNHVIDNIGPFEALSLDGIQSGIPLTVTPKQMRTIEKIVGRLPADQTGAKARRYFDEARRRGGFRIK